MKIRPLPEMDLARIAPLPADQKRRALEQMKEGRPPYSYDPLRKSILDILNVEPGPLGAGPRTPWSAIRADILKRAKRGPEEAAANLGVAEALYKLATKEAVAGRRQEFFPLNIGISQKISFWSPAVIGLYGKGLVPFIDPRRSAKNLNADARRFVFSVMHQRIRLADDDFAEIELGIFQFGTTEGGLRTPRLFTAANVVLLDFETLDSMVRETYAIWAEVLRGREEERRRDTGTDGPLFGG